MDKKFTTKWGFILAAVGSAIGMANVWGFPYQLGKNGGGAFLLIYIMFVLIFSFVGLSAEYAIGRRSHTGTLGSYEYAWKSRGYQKIGKIIGWIPLIGSLCIAIGYAVIIAYVLKALTQSIDGTLIDASIVTDTKAWFESFALTPYSVMPYHFIIIVVTLMTVFMGAKSIEKTNKIIMPIFFLLFIILAIKVATMDGAFEGYKFLFVPEWKQLEDPMVWISAMGQAFFSLSITGSGMIVYGAYLSKKEDIVDSAKKTAFFDTLASMLAALVMIPAVFAFSMDPAAGPGLLFVTLPKILQEMITGQIFAIILFLAVIFGGITSLQNMFEVVIESFLYKFPKLNRKLLLVLLCLICFGIGVNMEDITSWGPWMDFVCIYIIPVGAMLGAISWFWVLRKSELLEEVNSGARKNQGNFYHFVGRYVYVPMALTLCIIALSMKIAF